MSFVFDPHSIAVALQERIQLTFTDFILRVSHSFPAAAGLTGISVFSVPLGGGKIGHSLFGAYGCLSSWATRRNVGVFHHYYGFKV